MKKAGKKPVVIVISIVLLFAVLFGIWVLLSPGTIRKYDGEKSLSEKFVMEQYRKFEALGRKLNIIIKQ